MRRYLAASLTALIACNTNPSSSSSETPNPTPPTASPEAVGPEPGDEALCLALDSANLYDRVDAAEQLSDRLTHEPIGGTEQTMEAAGEWCVSTFGIRPGWLPGSIPSESSVLP